MITQIWTKGSIVLRVYYCKVGYGVNRNLEEM